MARRKHLQSLYLEPEQAERLDALSAGTRIPKAVLLREAVVDLLGKYDIVRERATSGPPRNVHRLVRKRQAK